jgi:hypothetical protein
MKKLIIFFLFIMPSISYGQLASFEHAPTLGKGKFGFIAGYSTFRYNSNDRSYTAYNSTGIQFGIGSSERVDFAVRYEKMIDKQFESNMDYGGV